MNTNLYDRALDGLDPELIEEHLQKKEALALRAVRRRRMTVAAAACVALVAVGVGVGIAMDNMNGFHEKPVHELGDVVIPYGHVAIHYITPDGHTAEATQYLPCDSQSIFAAWRAQNGIGEDVELIQTHTVSTGAESYQWIWEYEDLGEGGVSYRPGDKFHLTITLAGSDACFAGEGGEALMESLKKTLSGYTGLAYETVEVVFA